jgi:hypothetical protein
MPNAYTAVPSVIPGDLTVNGKLIISGGGGGIFARLFADASSHLWLTSNLKDAGGNSRDNAGFPAFALNMNSGARKLMHRYVSDAGVVHDDAVSRVIASDYTLHTHVGTVTEDTIYTIPIRALSLSANGSLRLLLLIQNNVQAAPNTLIRFRFGGVIAGSVAITSTVGSSVNLEFFLGNANATNAQICGLLVSGTIVPGSSALIGQPSPPLDTTLDQNLTVTIQNGTATDSYGFAVMRCELVNNFGPI